MKERIDIFLTESGYFESREQARRAIMAGEVFVDDKRIEKPSQLVLETGVVTVKSVTQKYVSRGAYKLEKALQTFGLEVEHRVCLDAGASTGGFTDLMLQSGARLVYAVDVGYGQLAWKIRQDSRVMVFERQNVRYFERQAIPELPSLITADLSFISLRLLLGKFAELLLPGGDLVTLIKPQFEAGRERVGKKGVVRDPEVHRDVLKTLSEDALKSGWTLKNLTFSPILGPEGNIEFLGHWCRGTEVGFAEFADVVKAAWDSLK